jgi:hypothetical protein
MRTEAEIQQVFDATYDEEVTTLEQGDEDEVPSAIPDTLRWVLGIDWGLTAPRLRDYEREDNAQYPRAGKDRTCGQLRFHHPSMNIMMKASASGGILAFTSHSGG